MLIATKKRGHLFLKVAKMWIFKVHYLWLKNQCNSCDQWTNGFSWKSFETFSSQWWKIYCHSSCKFMRNFGEQKKIVPTWSKLVYPCLKLFKPKIANLSSNVKHFRDYKDQRLVRGYKKAAKLHTIWWQLIIKVENLRLMGLRLSVANSIKIKFVNSWNWLQKRTDWSFFFCFILKQKSYYTVGNANELWCTSALIYLCQQRTILHSIIVVIWSRELGQAPILMFPNS